MDGIRTTLIVSGIVLIPIYVLLWGEIFLSIRCVLSAVVVVVFAAATCIDDRPPQFLIVDAILTIAAFGLLFAAVKDRTMVHKGSVRTKNHHG